MPSTDVKMNAKSGGRLAALDGVRGLAALIVLAHHSLYTNAAFPGTPGSGHAAQGSAMWWLSYTPLKLATAGWESVIVFFVLSGLVVTLPVVRKRAFDWIAYFPRRAVRLMVPVIASVLLAAAFVMAIPQKSTQPDGTWLSDSSTPNFSWEYIVKAWDLLGGDGQINNPLWSLRWELIFSLALPVFVVAALAVRKWWLGGLAAAVVLTWLGVRVDSGALSYLPAFFVGAVLAVRLEAVRNFADRMNARRFHHPFWFALTLGGSMLMIAPWLFGPGIADAKEFEAILKGLAPLGAAAIVVSAIGWSPLRALFESRPLQFAGTISFSLYLVHVPIIIFFTYLMAGQAWYVPLAFAVPAAILISVAFTWLIEKPSHGWARATGVWASERYRASFGRDQESHDASQATSIEQQTAERSRVG